MKYLKPFNESQRTDVDFLLRLLKRISADHGETLDYQINPDGSYDFFGNLRLGFRYLPEDVIIFGLPININNVFGSLTADYRGFDPSIFGQASPSLAGFPKYVNESFGIIECMQITSLEGCPKKVMGNFYVVGIGITDLEGVPENVRSVSFRNCPNLFFPKDFRDCRIEHVTGTEFEGTPLQIFVKIFGGLKTFQDSLDYNYLRGTKEKPVIDLFRFSQAIEEFDIELKFYWGRQNWLEFVGPNHKFSDPSFTPYKFGKWTFDNGERIDGFRPIIPST